MATSNQIRLRAPAARLARPPAEAGEKQARRLGANRVQIEKLMLRGTARRRVAQHGVGGEEAREEDKIAEQEEPEAVAHNDPLGRGSAGVVGRRILPLIARTIGIRVFGEECGIGSGHATPS